MSSEKSEKPTKQLTLRLSPEMHKKLKLLAVEQEKTLTDLVILWLSEKLNTIEKGR